MLEVPLRAVEPVGEEASRLGDPEPRSISDAAAAGDRRQLLVALRDHIARQIDDGVGARELAPLSRRLITIVAEIEAIDGAVTSAVAGAAATPDEEWQP